MEKPRNRFFVWVGLLAFNAPTAFKFFSAILTAYTAPADTRSLASDMTEFVKGVADWPLWMSLCFSIGSLALYAWSIFGAEGFLKAYAFVFRCEDRAAQLVALRAERASGRVRLVESRLKAMQDKKIDDMGRRLAAKLILEQDWFWKPVQGPIPPLKVAELANRLGTEQGRQMTEMQMRSTYKKQFNAVGASHVLRVEELAKKLNYPEILRRFEELRSQWQQPTWEIDMEDGAYFPDEAARYDFRHSLRDTWALKELHKELEAAIGSRTSNAGLPIISDFLPRLPQSTGSETQP
ncbi:MAG: hypothetical protein Q27BB25_10995 [Blastomonas sp. CACIA14H2]|jgi:hypothetical protein|uniref:hypothetical protein n=1 Tax=Blastomonas sp. CACIA14H2 TaxID=1419876 RepID=UPI0003CFE814|nr:MAG: hypothetical protein Q27BB25_10995 [Blastomonas sp. CACIA14H2]